MRILLIQPTPHTKLLGFERAVMPEPLGLEIVAASIPDHDVEIVDLRQESDLLPVLERFAPHVVGATALTTDVYAALETFKRVKDFSSDIFTIAGGHHATLVPDDFRQPYIDAICLGEGEIVFPRFINSLGGSLKGIPNLIWRDGDGFVDNGRVFEKPTLNANWPVPRRDLARSRYHFYSDQIVTVSTGRGCPCRCNFCSVWQFYGGYVRQLSAKRVVDEIRTIDCERIGFADDNFLINYNRDNEIANRIGAEGLERHYLMQCRTDYVVKYRKLVEKWVNVGLGSVLLGLESASDDLLQLINKRNDARTNDEAIKILQDLDVIIWAAFIIDPQWTGEDFDKLERYVKKYELTPIQYTVLTPLPGTDLYREKYHDLLTHDYRCFDTLHSVLPTRLPREEFYQRFAHLQSLRQIGKWYEWVSNGKVNIETLRTGARIAKQLGNWESYAAADPVLGGFI